MGKKLRLRILVRGFPALWRYGLPSVQELQGMGLGNLALAEAEQVEA